MSLSDVAADARRAHASLEAAYKAWREQPEEYRIQTDEARREQGDAWVIALGESRWRMTRAEADARSGSRWIDRHKKAGGK